MSSISISDMHNFVENMGSSDIQISSNIGNVIELGDEDLGDNFGADLLSTSRVSRPAPSQQQNVPAFEKLDDIGVTNMEPMETISFDIPSSSQMPPTADVFINHDDPFSNNQTATGPSIQLSSATRMNPDEERKKKMDLINKLNRLETKGYNLSKRFTMDNTLEEISQEHDRLLDAKNLEASLRFQRQCLMGVVTGAEFMNSKFNPFDWELDGWSESVHENIEDFDEVFEELYDKYKGRGNMPPEAKLMMSLVGSGFMFHMSNSFFRSKMNNINPSDIFRGNPDLAKQFAAAAAQQAGPGFGNFMGAAMGVPQQQAPQQSAPGPFYQSPQVMASQQPAPGPRREMKGPTGMDDILKTFQEVRSAELDPLPPMFTAQQSFAAPQQPAVQAMSEISSIHTGEISDNESVRTGMTAQRGGRGRRKASAPVANTMTLNL